MAGPNEQYTIGNILGIIATALFSAGFAFYAYTSDRTGRIGKSWEFCVLLGVGGAAYLSWRAVKAVQSRRR